MLAETDTAVSRNRPPSRRISRPSKSVNRQPGPVATFRSLPPASFSRPNCCAMPSICKRIGVSSTLRPAAGMPRSRPRDADARSSARTTFRHCWNVGASGRRQSISMLSSSKAMPRTCPSQVRRSTRSSRSTERCSHRIIGRPQLSWRVCARARHRSGLLDAGRFHRRDVPPVQQVHSGHSRARAAHSLGRRKSPQGDLR